VKKQGEKEVKMAENPVNCEKILQNCEKLRKLLTFYQCGVK
jgi:hypothetical protein